MPSDGHLVFRLRLEDLVALAFFLITFSIRMLVEGFRQVELSPADVLIIIPAVSLLIAKEIAHYFVVGRKTDSGDGEGIRKFVHPYWEIIRDWFPFLVILMMYYSLWGDATHLLVTRDRDAALISLDQKLFGFQASVALQRIISPPLTSWMEFSYAFHVINIPLVACFVYLRRSRGRFREMMSGVLLITFFGLLGYLLVPAIGPVYTLRDQFTVPLSQPLRVVNQQIDFLDYARIKRDVFPSLHAGISFVVWLYAYRNSRRLAWILAPVILSLWVSTVYLRYHYLIDVVAGLALAPLCFLMANWLFKRFGEIPVSLGLPRAWVGALEQWGLVPRTPNSSGKADESS